MNAAKTLRKDILAVAEAAGIRTQTRLAKAMRISPQYLNDMLNGKAMGPKAVDKAVRALKVDEATARRWHLLGATEAGWKVEFPRGASA